MVPVLQSERGRTPPPVPPMDVRSVGVPKLMAHSEPSYSAVTGVQRRTIWSMYQPARPTQPVTAEPLGQSRVNAVPLPPRWVPVVMVSVLAVQV